MKLAERRFIRLTILAWVLIYGLFLAQMLSAELPRGANWQILAFGVVFIALAAGLATAVVFAMPARIIMNLMLKDRRRSHCSETIALTILLVLIVAYIIEVSRERMSLAPPKGVATLSAFADAMPPPRRLELVRSDGRDFIAVTMKGREVSHPRSKTRQRHVPSAQSTRLLRVAAKKSRITKRRSRM